MTHARIVRGLGFAAAALAVSAALAADVTKPAAVAGLAVDKSGGDAVVSWSAVTTDDRGRGGLAVPRLPWRDPELRPRQVRRDEPRRDQRRDELHGRRRLGVGDRRVLPRHRRGRQRRRIGDEARPRSRRSPCCRATTPTPASILRGPQGLAPAQVAKYLVYYGSKSHTYDSVKDAGLALSTSMAALLLERELLLRGGGGGRQRQRDARLERARRLRRGAHHRHRARRRRPLLLGGGQSCPPRPGTVQRSDRVAAERPVTFPREAGSRRR